MGVVEPWRGDSMPSNVSDIYRVDSLRNMQGEAHFPGGTVVAPQNLATVQPLATLSQSFPSALNPSDAHWFHLPFICSPTSRKGMGPDVRDLERGEQQVWQELRIPRCGSSLGVCLQGQGAITMSFHHFQGGFPIHSHAQKP